MAHGLHHAESAPTRRVWQAHAGCRFSMAWSTLRFPLMSPQGGPGDTRNCGKCHINDSETTPRGVNDVRDPQGYINPAKTISAACIGCHVSAAASSHMVANTTDHARSGPQL